MKFSKNLARNQVPEWGSEYIDYKGLKKLIKSAAEERSHGREADLAGFFFSLDRNLEDVDYFYNKKFGDVFRQLKLLNERFGNDKSVLDGTNKDEIEDITAILLDLRGQLRKLQWYGEVNRRGFIKITKKLDKKVASACAQQQYLQTRVDPRPFATNAALSKAMNGINTWLSRLSEVQTLDDASSTRSSISLAKGSNAIASLPNELLDDLEKSISEDNSKSLANAIDEMQEYEAKQSNPFQKAIIHLLQRAISLQSRKCITSLLGLVPDLNEDDDFNGRNCLHRLIITIARPSREEEQSMEDEQGGNFIVPAEAPTLLQMRARGNKEADNMHEDRLDMVAILKHVLDSLSATQRPALTFRDHQGKMPLHYASQLGSASLCKLLLATMQAWKQFHPSQGVDPKAWEDVDSNTPLHLSVIEGHPLTTQVLLDACRQAANSQVDGSDTPARVTIHNSLLLSGATKRNFVRIIRLLCEAGADVNEQDDGGETALHVAARFGHLECAQALVKGSSWHSVNLEIGEKTFGWTPLLVASVDGHLELVKFFVEEGAKVDTIDTSGWTAKEHAALRGHLGIAALLNKHTNRLSSIDALPRSPRVKPTDPSPLEDRSSRIANGQNGGAKASVGIKSFGHRYLTDESLILVSLGSMDNRKHVDPVKLDTIPIKEAHATQLDTALSIVVSSSGASGEPTTIDLPVQENISTEPVAFYAKDPSKVKILFDIVPTYSGAKDKVIGRGVAMLSHVKSAVGTKKMNLQGDITVPVVAAKTLDYIGSVNFNFLIVRPFKHPKMTINESQTYWKRLTAPMVIGHRGLGKNLNTRTSLQLGENTIQSFIAAANLGASYVEFDVQLTKDHVPVIYHDFLVSETGIDAPVHTLTLEQFMHVNESTSGPGRSGSPARSFRERVNSSNNADNGRPSLRAHRANSVGAPGDTRREEMTERMKHTRDFKIKGFKGNSRGSSIQAPFTTLEEMLKKLPESIGFNIEMKYPMLFETEEAEMDTYAFELNSFVDTVLTKVYDLCNNRDIIFSSFNPDICLLLSFKQPSIPVLFLTDAGASTVGDIRASSLQEAIRFASRWNLLGIVSASEPLVYCPRLVKVVKESGLVCVSYGTQNNNPENVKLQVSEGIDAVIVDSVLAIRKGLTHEQDPNDPKILESLVALNGHTNPSFGTPNGSNTQSPNPRPIA